MVALYRRPLMQAFFLGLTTGIVYFTGTLYWITRVMVVYGGLTFVVSLLVNAALIAYLALFPAIFGIVVARVTSTGRTSGLILAPFVWVATELGRTHLFTGFPWVLLGYSQMPVLPIAQSASVVGVYGVSALVASVSATLAIAAVGEKKRYRPLIITVAIVAGVAIWGSARIRDGRLLREGDSVRVGLLQGNVDQADKWNDARAAEIFRSYLRMTEQAVDQGASFVLWPESSTPYRFDEDLVATEAIRTIARQRHVPILLGSDQFEPGPTAKYYNAAFLVRSDGTDGGAYQKMHLVPFGEYVPLKRLFFFAARLVEAVSDFSPGTKAVVLPVDGHSASVAICYEIVYPNLVRQFVRGGSQLLTTITNDAWFGPTSAPYQHFAQASMRAIENGRFLVRAANTGISGIVDPYGRATEMSEIFKPAVVVGEARFLTTSTIYSRTGDLFAYASLVAVAMFLVFGRRRVQ